LRIYLTIPVTSYLNSKKEIFCITKLKDQDVFDEFNELSSTKSLHCLHVVRDRRAKEFIEQIEMNNVETILDSFSNIT